ncbi:hypothetical protein J4439_02025 [Candidatus Woesearchaeota archaeon]|nr:hypothetical protein [Candidatus Woesearchaeota archaeon]
MRLKASILVEDKRGVLAEAALPDFSVPVKRTKVGVTHDSGWTRFEVDAADVSTGRAAVSAIMSAVKVFDGMSEVADGTDTRH